MIGYLEKALNVRRNELLPASLLFSYLFLVIGSYIMGQAVGDSLFLNAFPNYLPHGIMATAVVVGIFVSVYIRLSHHVRLERLIIGTLLFFTLWFILFWWTSRFGSKWVYALNFVWVYVAGAMGPTMGWTLANYVLTTREARRVFGFIGAGAILGGIFAGFFINVHIGRLENFMLVVALAFATCALLVKLLFRQAHQRLAGVSLSPAAGEEAPKNFRQSLALIGSSRYLLLITALIAVGCVCTTIIGYQFKMIAKAAFTTAGKTDKIALAEFFGSFYGWMGLASFLLQLIATGRLLRSFGIRVTLFILPIVFLGGSTVVLLVPMLLTAAMLKGSHTLLRYSVDKSSTELLYLPVTPDVKSQIKSFIDTFIWRVADGVAGLVLWLFANIMNFSPSRISLVNFAFLLGWIGAAYGVRKEYLNVLRRAIERRTLDPERTAAGVLDSTTTDELALALQRGDEQQVLYGLSLFEVGREAGWHPMMRGLLEHPSPRVRLRALRLLRDARDLEVVSQIEKMVGDESPEIRTEALHYLVVYAGRDPLSLLSTETDIPDYSLQGSMVAYLALTARPENLAAARLIFQEMLSLNRPDAGRSRAEAARVLGVVPPPFELHSELGNLLRDEDQEVLENALVSAGKIQEREYLPLLIEKLGNRRLATLARSALVQYGERAVGTLQDYLNDETVPLAVRKQIPYVLARIPTAQSAAVLSSSLIQSDPGLRFDVLKGLNKLRRRAPELVPPNALAEDLLYAELMGYYRSFQILAAFDPQAGALRRDSDKQTVLIRALRERMDYEFERIFRLLGLLYAPRDIHNAYVGLTSSRPQLQANALEVLENLLRPEIYRPLAYVLDHEITLREKLNFAERLCRVAVPSRTEALRILLHSDDRWLRACALHEVGEVRLAELQADVRQVAHEGDKVLEETLNWARARLAEAPA